MSVVFLPKRLPENYSILWHYELNRDIRGRHKAITGAANLWADLSFVHTCDYDANGDVCDAVH